MTGIVEPWLEIHGERYTREQVFAIYNKAERGERLTDQEARVAAGWCIHPLNGPLGLQPFVIGSLLMKRQVGSVSDSATAEPAAPPRRSEALK
jgi:hypothetical protein